VRAVISGVLLLFGATAAFASLQNALNRAWNVKPDPRRGQIRNFLAKRVFSFGVMITVGFMLLVSLSLTATLSALGTRLTSGLGIPEPVLRVIDVALSFALVTLLFAAMFKLLPDAKIAWRDVVVGAVGTAIFFVLGKLAIGYYLGRSDPGSAYGAAGSLAIIMIWVYYTSMIVLFGAMFTRVWAERYGRGVHPEKGAVEFAEIEKRVEEG
jgi:membrane protein